MAPSAMLTQAAHEQLMRVGSRGGKHEGELSTEPDPNQRADTNPGWNKDKQAWRTNNAPVTRSQRSYLATFNNLLDSRDENHTHRNQQIAQCQERKSITLKTVPGKTAKHDTHCNTATCHQFVQTHDAHAQRLISRGIISEISKHSRHLHSGRDSGE